MTTDACVVFTGAKKFKKLEKPVRRVLFFIFKHFGARDSCCEVHCLTDAAMRKLNRSVRGRDESTTVLSFLADPSFPRPDMPHGARYLGEIYVAPDIIARKGEWPLSRYLIHGALHLFGYTHAGQSDRIEMESREEEVAERLKEADLS